ncbi:MAG: ABC transporter permease subunit [Candidatus Hydrogenedens sp.]|nr:ABC transporter permease subunit [Candidatus Hydrogenedens sp.]
MPVYKRTYRNYDGAYVPRFRWWLVVKQEFRVLGKYRIFLALMLVAQLHTLVRFLQILAYDVIMQDPNNILTPLLSQVDFIVVNQRMFYEYVQLQAPLLLVFMLYAGSGMICNDFRNNLMEVYFSKPIRWRDYVAGKLLALILLGLSITALPAVILVVLHNILLPSWELLQASWWWPLSLLAFSLLLVVPCALATLASSALLRSQGFAAVSVFMVLSINSSMGVILARLLYNRDYLLVSFPATLYRLGQELFDVPGYRFQSDWRWSMAFVAVVCVVSLAAIVRTVRRAEIAA